MDNETLQKHYDKLLQLSLKARGARREAEKYRGSAYWEKARYWERQLDAFIKAEMKEKQSQQRDLF